MLRDWSKYIDELLIEIDSKREEMIEEAISSGFTSERTVKCSQELDQLLNHYQQVKEVKHNKILFQLYIKQAILFFYGNRFNLRSF